MKNRKMIIIVIGLVTLVGCAHGCAAVKDLLHPVAEASGDNSSVEQGLVTGNDTSLLKDLLHFEQAGKDAALVRVDPKVDVAAAVKAALADFSKQLKVEAEQKIKQEAGRDNWTISPIINIMGNGWVIAIIGVAVVLSGLAGGRVLRIRRMLGVIVKAIEDLPEEVSKDKNADQAKKDQAKQFVGELKKFIAKSSYSAGVSQAIYNAVQAGIERPLKGQKIDCKEMLTPRKVSTAAE